MIKASRCKRLTIEGILSFLTFDFEIAFDLFDLEAFERLAW